MNFYRRSSATRFSVSNPQRVSVQWNDNSKNPTYRITTPMRKSGKFQNKSNFQISWGLLNLKNKVLTLNCTQTEKKWGF